MSTPTRSIRPKCPECGFSIFNRRFGKCESCGVQLPSSIVYTADELKALVAKDKADDEAAQKTRHKRRTNSSGDAGYTGDGGWGDAGGDGGGSDDC
jgi:hypothetical protein